MKLFTNKLTFVLSVGLILAACSGTPEEQPASELAEETVEEVATVPQKIEPVAETKTESAEVKTAPKTLQPKKTSSNEAVLNLQAWDKKLKFLKTHFDQTTSYDGVPVSTSQGTLYYDKDKHLLRLDTLNTDGNVEQSAITDKNQILILDGKGREITTLSWQEWQQGQPNQALFDFGNYTALLARHNATLKEPYLLELTPKAGEPYTLYLTLSKEDYFPTNIKIVADLMTTEAVLSNTQKNETLPFDTFRAGGLFK